jgi:small-conductance mechanosensitive channel
MQMQYDLTTPAHLGSTVLLLACGALLSAAIGHLAIVRLLRAGTGQLAQQTYSGHEARARVWLAHLLHSMAAPLAMIIWVLAIHFATTEVLGALEAGQRPVLVRSLEWLRGAAVALALLWLLLRVGKVLDTRLTALAKRTASRADDLLLPLLGKGVRVVLPLLALMLGTSALEVSPETRSLLRDATSLLIIAAVSFMLLQTVDAVKEFLLRQYRLDVENNYRARAIHTQVVMLRRLAVAVIGILTLASMLMVFDSVRRFGTTILASAGVAGVVIGFAAQRSIATLLAGFQIALTQPIRIDDVVIVEGEWGRIEEITLTYVIVNLWDMRRLVVPITYFIEKPFQNWTRSSAQIMGSIFFYLDYRVPMEALRKEYERTVRASTLWDGVVCVLQVTDTKERCIEVRGLVSAANASTAFDLRCEIREKMLVWLTAQYPHALPRIRLDDRPCEGPVTARATGNRQSERGHATLTEVP